MLTISRDRGTMRPGAHRMQSLLADFIEQGVLERPAILVTGTNGKGTASAFLEAALRAAGLRTGLYTSPHLVSATERIRVEGRPVPSQLLSTLLAEAQSLAKERLCDASSFELVTAAALLHFLRMATDVDVVEIGLGGLLDSTNALAPVVSVLTSIALEHTEILGATETQIAFDKAHVSRRNRPLVAGAVSPEARAAIERCAERTGARVVWARNALDGRYESLYSDLLGRAGFFVQASRANLRVALAALNEWERETGKTLPLDKVAQGILETRWPGRFDVRTVGGREIVFDAAHNVAGIEFFLRMLAESPYARSRFHVVYATLSDKDWARILPLVAPLAATLVLTQVSSERAVPAESLRSALPPGTVARVVPALEQALKEVREGPEGPILVVGSIALVGESMELLGLAP